MDVTAKMAMVVGHGLALSVALVLGSPSALAQAAPKPAKQAQFGPPQPPEIVPSPQDQPPQTPPDAPQGAAAVPARPVCDVACVRRGADPAAQACVPLIEAKSPIDYDWLSRPFGGMFTQAEPPGPDGIVRYRGDSIRVLLQGQWLRHAYECAWDPAAGKIVGVRLLPGRLVPPAPVAQLAGNPVGQRATAQVKTPEQAKQMIRDALQRGAQQQAQAGQGQPPAPPRPKRRWGEPSPISIEQARLATPSGDSTTAIRQALQKRH
jgi:hypothetical protein